MDDKEYKNDLCGICFFPLGLGWLKGRVGLGWLLLISVHFSTVGSFLDRR